MPIAVAAALFCAPLASQTRPSENNPKRLIEKADRLAWVYNWYLAGPLYAEAEKLFEQAGDARNALYAKIGRLRSEWETMSFPEVSEYLAAELDLSLVQNDPQLRLWILDAKGAVDLEVNGVRLFWIFNFPGNKGQSRWCEILRLCFLVDDFQPAATAGRG